MKKLLLFVFVLFGVSMQFARYHMVTSHKSFEKLINKYPYAVVCFAESRGDKDELSKEELRDMRSEYRSLKRRVQGASNARRYKEYLRNDVGFVLVDVASGKAEEITDDFSFTKYPTCILFKRGKAYAIAKQYAQIFDPISKSSILTLLEKHFNDELEELVEDKKEEEQLRREERIARYNAHARYGYPYYGYGWGWGYPYHSYGWGWGGYRGGCW